MHTELCTKPNTCLKVLLVGQSTPLQLDVLLLQKSRDHVRANRVGVRGRSYEGSSRRQQQRD